MLGYICIYSGSLCSYVYTHARFDRIKVQVFVTYNNYVWVSVCVNIYIQIYVSIVTSRLSTFRTYAVLPKTNSSPF